MQPACQPGGVILLLPLGGLPAEPVDVSADEEEDRHHLEEPGQPAGPADEGERVRDHHLPVRRIEGDDEPMADDDDADGGGAQEVDVAVAFGWGLGGETGGLGPDGKLHGGLQGWAAAGPFHPLIYTMGQGERILDPRRDAEGQEENLFCPRRAAEEQGENLKPSDPRRAAKGHEENLKPFDPRRAAKDHEENLKPFNPRRAAKDHEENLKPFDPRRAAKKTLNPLIREGPRRKP